MWGRLVPIIKDVFVLLPHSYAEGMDEVNEQKGIQKVFGEAGRKAWEGDPEVTLEHLKYQQPLWNTAPSPITFP